VDDRERPVFRAAVLSIVLAVAAAPSAATLCQIWCDSQAATAACHPEALAPSSTAAGASNCDRSLSLGAVLPEEARRGLAAPGAMDAGSFFPLQLAQLTTDARRHHEPGREWWLVQRPPTTALRI
jgi:hypothetical protein